VDAFAVIASSTLIAAVVGAGAGYVSQRALASRQALIDYDYKARSRLYEAVGPLRFQLLIACRDVVHRVAGHTREKRWRLDPADYYGSNTMYRLLRPLAVCILIERQMNAADFSVDPSTVRLLRFEINAYRMLTNADPVEYYEKLDWGNQSQHMFHDNLRRAATRLITADAHVMDYATFHETYPDPRADEAIAPLARIFEKAGESLTRAPVFWVRIVGYAYLCQDLIDVIGAGLGFAEDVLDVPALLKAVDDPQVLAKVGEQEAIYRAIADRGL
jgi:hypothetical protein